MRLRKKAFFQNIKLIDDEIISEDRIKMSNASVR